MKVLKRFLYTAVMLLILCASNAAQAQPFAYISNQADDTVSVINTATNTVTRTIPVGNAPLGVAVSLDGTRVYVANIDDGTVSVIDGATNSIVTTVSVGGQPHGVAVNPDGTRVYAANKNSGTVSVIDTATNSVVATTNVGTGPIALGDFVGPLTGDVQFLGLSPSKLGIYKAGDTITVRANAIGPEPIQYRFWSKAGYGTPAYDTNPWVIMRDWGLSNKATHTFTTADNYIIVVWGTNEPTTVDSANVPIIGLNINVKNP